MPEYNKFALTTIIIRTERL